MLGSRKKINIPRLPAAHVSALLNRVQTGQFNFAQVIEFIDNIYEYQPVSFYNGPLVHAAGESEGSAKVFGFAKLHDLSVLDTLSLFAEHYQAVKGNEKGTDHPNIRNFIRYGWSGFRMDHLPFVRVKPN